MIIHVFACYYIILYVYDNSNRYLRQESLIKLWQKHSSKQALLILKSKSHVYELLIELVQYSTPKKW